jgi:hypothetical protein
MRMGHNDACDVLRVRRGANRSRLAEPVNTRESVKIPDASGQTRFDTLVSPLRYSR